MANNILINKKLWLPILMGTIVVSSVVWFNRDVVMNGSGRVIKTPGKYNVDKNIVLIVQEQQGLLDFKIIVGGKTNLPVTCDYSVSTYSDWGLYWEQDADRLWLASGDVGDFVYIKDSQGDYYCYLIYTKGTPVDKNLRVFWEDDVPPKIRQLLDAAVHDN